MKRMLYRVLVLLMGLSTQFPGGYAQSLDGVILPAKTKIFVSLQRSLNSKTVSPGDAFVTVVDVPVTINDRIVIPVGSYIQGFVASKEEAGYLQGKASLLLGFDTVILRNGITRELRAQVQSAEGYELDPKSEKGKLTGGGDQVEEVAVGAVTGAVIGLVMAGTAHVFSRANPRSFEIATGVGAMGGGVLALMQKGEEVKLQRGSSLTIELY
ncbi:MAG: hypothetical protein ACWGQW_08470, partial [bacterium]